MIPFKGLNYNPAIQAVGQDLFESGTGVYSSIVSAWRANPLNLASVELEGSNPIERMIAQEDPNSDIAIQLGPRLTAEEANKKYGLSGVLTFDEDIYDYDAKLRNENASVSVVRGEQIQRAKKGFWNGTARFSAELLASLADPINVATSFVPIGQARWAKVLLGGMGPNKARLARGFLEGSVGAAMLEPAMFALNDSLGLEYGFEDSLLNIGLGATLGAGLHFGAPLTRDVFNWGKNKVSNAVFGRKLISNNPDIPDLPISDFKPDDTVLRSTVAQIIDGQQVDGAVRIQVNNELARRARLKGWAKEELSIAEQGRLLQEQVLGISPRTTPLPPDTSFVKASDDVSDADIQAFENVRQQYEPVAPEGVTEGLQGGNITTYRVKSPDGKVITYQEKLSPKGRVTVDVKKGGNEANLSPQRLTPETRINPENIDNAGHSFNPDDPEANIRALDQSLVGFNEAQTYNKSLSPDDYKVAEEQTIAAKERLVPATLETDIAKLQKEVNESQRGRAFLDNEPEELEAYKAAEENLKRIEKAEKLYMQAAICIIGGANG